MAGKSDWIVHLDAITSAENHFAVLAMELPTLDPLGRALWPFSADDVHRLFEVFPLSQTDVCVLTL